MFSPNVVKADESLASELVKQQARQFCGTEAYEESNEMEEPNGDFETLASAFVNQTATSKSGSTFILPTGKFKRFGYCHTYTGHMARSNGSIGHAIGPKTQLKYAYTPAKTMKIAMEVINSQNTLVPDGGGYYYKQIYSPTDGQVVKVVFHTTPDFEGGAFSKYKYVIITMYPV